MDLFGWDTIFVGGIDTVIRALAGATKELLRSFTITEGGLTESGTFGTWSILTPGTTPSRRVAMRS